MANLATSQMKRTSARRGMRDAERRKRDLSLV
jgi:hypothetical protein